MLYFLGNTELPFQNLRLDPESVESVMQECCAHL